ncbi:ATP-dependent protease La domain protein [Lunatimonas lonarensis]|uniref:ATP-dependent protease La domain protein n=1 Tax=Lunatimonas lonarensis TaxID=1232681 RepID=R7ZNP9_9BACT|nr:LON peptidase substrate-binding domain-containing protein [Lunatimonas lonarensis]EON75735.1 ATP-dependent protease La domain protein [Lunatimonas lonarensis]
MADPLYRFDCVPMNTITLPFFPLKLVAFPGEKLNLHVFEPRYKQLIGDCLLKGSTFGICVYLDKLTMYGTEVSILEVSKTYEDGRMDIQALGIRPFRIVNFRNPMGEKLYAGGEVSILEGDEFTDTLLYAEFKELMVDMLQLLGLPENEDFKRIDTYNFSHKIGLSLEEEFKLLLMRNEAERLRFLVQHLRKALPILVKMEEAKRKIQMNGYFKNLDPLNF